MHDLQIQFSSQVLDDGRIEQGAHIACLIACADQIAGAARKVASEVKPRSMSLFTSSMLTPDKAMVGRIPWSE